MGIKNTIFISLVVIIFFACSSLKIAYDYDPTQDFSSYKTYRWAKLKERDPSDVLSKNPMLRKRVQMAADLILEMKGFEKLKKGDPDFIIFIHAGVQPRMNVYYHGPYWYHPWWGPYGGYTSVSYYEQGTLVIDIVDRKEKELSWRSIASDVLKRYSDLKDLQEYINNVVSLMLEDFPPK